MIFYFAKINYDKSDEVYNVSFPDLDGCFTFGDSFEEALENAKEALSAYLESINFRDLNIPEAKNYKGKTYFKVAPHKNISFAIWLRLKRIEKGYSQKDMAKLLNISYQSYQRYEQPETANPTLKRIEQIEQVFSEDLITV